MGDTGQEKRAERQEQGTERTDSDDAARRQDAKDARVRLLRSKAALARSEADAMATMHLDPDTLDQLMDSASPTEANRLRKSEEAIALRVAKAVAAAETAEDEYEQAVLEQYDDTRD
jgi:tellurite resistance protein